MILKSVPLSLTVYTWILEEGEAGVVPSVSSVLEAGAFLPGSESLPHPVVIRIRLSTRQMIRICFIYPPDLFVY